MGTLDDAIREHLELKKRAGASDDEVRQLETEAFGPPRSAAPAPEREAAPATEEAALPGEETGPGPEAVIEPPARPEAVPPAEQDTWLEDDEDEAPQHTSEFTAAEAADAEGRPPDDYVAPDEEGDDLLEETPDFLQETPEHDRLWFEQKPPRDFDFDE
jgi:hypothetical protein